MGTALANFLFSYFYIRVENEVWPPQGITLPDPSLSIWSVSILLISLAAMRWAVKGIEKGNQRFLRMGWH